MIASILLFTLLVLSLFNAGYQTYRIMKGKK